jgi:predicted transcriptional regulator
MALNKNLIEPLMDWKFIDVEKIGSRHIVSLTDEGINALRFLHEGGNASNECP